VSFGTFGTPVGTLHQLVHCGLLAHYDRYWSIFDTFGTVGTFRTPVVLVTLRIGSVFSMLGIIPNEVWYIWYTLHCTSYSSVHSGNITISRLEKSPPYWNSGFDFTVLRTSFYIRLSDFMIIQIGPSSLATICYIDFQNGGR